MSVSGLCEVCQQREASNRCDRCGSFVCSQHYAAERGLCVTCAREER